MFPKCSPDVPKIAMLREHSAEIREYCVPVGKEVGTSCFIISPQWFSGKVFLKYFPLYIIFLIIYFIYTSDLENRGK